MSASQPAARSVKPETVEGKNGSLESRAAVPAKGRTPVDKVVEKAGAEPVAAASAHTASAKTIVPEPEQPSALRAAAKVLPAKPVPTPAAEAKREKAEERRSTPEKRAPESVEPSPLKTPASARTGRRGEKEPGPGRAFPTEAEFMANLPPLPTEEVTDEDKGVEKAGTEPLAAASAPTASAKTIVPEPEPPSELPMPAQTAEAKREKADERRSTTEKRAPESVEPSPLKTPASARTGGRGEKEPGPGRAFPTEAEFMTNLPPLPTGEATDEAQEAELLQTVEEQFKDLPPMEEPAPAPFWETVEVVEAEPAPKPQPDYSPPAYVIHCMFIVQITPELAPVAKVGGLADVVFGLSRELEIRGNDVEIILPKYDCLRYDHIWGLCETYRDLWVPWYGGAIRCTVFFGFVHGRKCFFIEPHSADKFFNRGNIYGFNDDVMRFAFFSIAAMEFIWKSGKHPEIIHCHDWQTALVPVFLYEIYQQLGMRHPRSCFTIHNFKHQGVTGAQLLNATGLHRPEYYFHYDRLRDNHNRHALNLMKAGVVYSNFVTTVSPRHATEAKDQGQGFGLEPTLHIHHQKYGGVVNGIDYEVWNPELDRCIPFHYNIHTIDDKYHNKRALRGRLLIADSEKPIVAFVGRLDPQKGLELIRHAIFYVLQRGGQFVLLGSSPDPQINNYFWSLKRQLNEHPDCHIEIGFNEELAHLIYAGADMVIVPSRFEPCGLAQLIAMRYGAIPIVRETGGLADTVIDKDFSHRPLHERNGYVFRDYDAAGLELALGRAISCYYEFPEHFRELMKNAMRCDYSWKNPGQDYLNIYDYIRDK